MISKKYILHAQRNILQIIIWFCFSLCCNPFIGIGQTIDKEWIIQIEANASIESLLEEQAHLANQFSFEIKKEISNQHKVYLIAIEEISQLRNHHSIQYIQANRKVKLRETIPDDEFYNEQWSIPLTQINEVWSSSTGGTTLNGDSIVVAIIDRGFEHLHEDLKDNVWTNKAEIPNDGIDNDENGFIDDFFGWNFRFNNNQHNQLPNSGIDHGTAVAGIVGAVGNNSRGVVGVNWDVKMMLLSVKGNEADILSAYFYILDQRRLYNESNGAEGAFVAVSSISLGIDQGNPTDYPIWCNLYNELGEAGIINVAATTNTHTDVDTEGDIPTACASDFLLTVTNTNEHDLLVHSAGYGLQSIDIGAPGNNSFTTDIEGSYGLFNGTSASTPLVAGTIALLYSLPCERVQKQIKLNPSQTALFMKNTLLQSVDKLETLENMTTSGGRLNANNAMLAIRDYCIETNERLRLLIHANPNPVAPNKDVIRFDYETFELENLYFFMYNAMGVLVHEAVVTPQAFRDNIIEFPNVFPEGVYFITLRNERGWFRSTKLVIN